MTTVHPRPYRRPRASRAPSSASPSPRRPRAPNSPPRPRTTSLDSPRAIPLRARSRTRDPSRSFRASPLRCSPRARAVLESTAARRRRRLPSPTPPTRPIPILEAPIESTPSPRSPPSSPRSSSPTSPTSPSESPARYRRPSRTRARPAARPARASPPSRTASPSPPSLPTPPGTLSNARPTPLAAFDADASRSRRLPRRTSPPRALEILSRHPLPASSRAHRSSPRRARGARRRARVPSHRARGRTRRRTWSRRALSSFVIRCR